MRGSSARKPIRSYRDGRFVNLQPETPTSLASLGDYIVRQFSGDEVREPPAPLPVMTIDKAALAAAPAPSGLRAFWIGHASTYVELDELRLLLDPVFAERVSLPPVGPRRFHAPPIALADLPPIDAVLISHDHYDHLDMHAVRHLAARGSESGRCACSAACSTDCESFTALAMEKLVA